MSTSTPNAAPRRSTRRERLARTFPQIDTQEGLATKEQLLGAGWTESAIRHLASIAGQSPYTGVYAWHRGPLTDAQLLVGAYLWAGPDAVLTGARALALSGLEVPAAPRAIRLLVPHNKRRRACGDAVTLRTTRPPDRRRVRGYLVAAPERALVDAGRAREFDGATLRALTISALQRRLTTVARLTAELTNAPRNGTAWIRRGLTDFDQGAWSVPEAVLGNLLRKERPGLRVLYNCSLSTPNGRVIGFPDAYLPDHGIAVLVHSSRFHEGIDARGKDRWEATVEADSHYTEHGIAALGVTPTALRDRPERFLTRLDAVVAIHPDPPKVPIVVTLQGSTRAAA
jgi:hypothetical protein